MHSSVQKTTLYLLLVALVALVVAHAGTAEAADACAAPHLVSPASSSADPDSDYHSRTLASSVTVARAAYAAANRLRAENDATDARFHLLLDEALDAVDEDLSAEHRGTALLHVARSLDLRLTGRDPKSTESRRLARRAVDLLAETAGISQSVGSPRMRAFAEGYRAEIYHRSGRTKEALVLNDAALLAAARADEPDLVARWATQRGRFLERLGRDGEALLSFRLAREAVDQLRGQVAPRDFLLVASPVIRGLVDLLLRQSEAAGGPQILRAEAIDALEDLKADQIRDFFDDPCLIGARESGSVDPGDAAVVYPILLDSRAELLIAHSNGIERLLLAESPQAFEALAHRFAEQLQDPTSKRYRRSARQLYQLMIEPVKELLLESTSTIVFVPPRSLLGVPFAALQDPASGEFLIQKRAVAVTPSFRLSSPRPIAREEIISIVAGLTVPAPGFEPLAFIAEEIASVAESFPGRKLVGTEFTADRIEASLREAPVGILHIASHAVFEENAAESFVVTANGRILLDDFADLIAKTRFRTDRPLELLTLSTCESARGNDEALLGLAGIAIRSGARSALGSLWPVQDRATAHLMRRFYRELARPGVQRAEALRRAQSALIADDGFDHPAFWAPFQVLNDWR